MNIPLEGNPRVAAGQATEQGHRSRRPSRRRVWECGLSLVTHRSGDGAFTRVDLLAVIFVVFVLFLVLLPALAKPGINSKSIQCLYNHHQLCNAWRMYADDSSDRITFASTGASTGRNGSSTSTAEVSLPPSDPNYWAWSGAHLDFAGGAVNRADWDPRVDMMLRPLWSYVQTVSVYKCPSDQSVCPNATGDLVPRLLSVSLNLYLGGFAAAGTGGGNDGGWSFADAYRIYSKISDLGTFSPAKAFVFTDHRPDNINWGDFFTDMTGNTPANSAALNFLDWPGFYHDGGAALSFADGHTELHRWIDPRTTPAVIPGIGTSPGNPDVAWLQAHSTRLK